MLLGALTSGIALIAFGAHAVVPWRLAGAADDARRRWSRLALPVLLLAILLLLMTGARRPDVAIATGLGWSGASSPAGRAIAIALAGLLLGDALIFFAGPRPERGAWWLLGTLGAVGLLGGSLAAELLRLGEGPDAGAVALLAAAVCRAGVGLAAGQNLEAERPSLAPLGAVALVLYFLALPPAVRTGLLRAGDELTFGAAAALLALVRFLPPRFRRAVLLVGTLLAAVAFARAAAVSAVTGGLRTTPLGPLNEP